MSVHSSYGAGCTIRQYSVSRQTFTVEGIPLLRSAHMRGQHPRLDQHVNRFFLVRTKKKNSVPKKIILGFVPFSYKNLAKSCEIQEFPRKSVPTGVKIQGFWVVPGTKSWEFILGFCRKAFFWYVPKNHSFSDTITSQRASASATSNEQAHSREYRRGWLAI